MAENTYASAVFLEDQIRAHPDLDFPAWTALQRLQYEYLVRADLTPASVVLDVGCGPLRLGSALIPTLEDGWYYGLDVNPETLQLGRELLERQGIPAERLTLIESTEFDTAEVDRPVDLAFANSLFSHLNLNSISQCLTRVAEVLPAGRRFYSTFFLVPEDEWSGDHHFEYFGRRFTTHAQRDPYHYTERMMRDLATWTGFAFEIDQSYAHESQTMGVFTKLPTQHSRGSTRVLELEDQAFLDLRPGADHYRAFVGPPSQYDFMGATQFRLLTTLGLRDHHRVLDVGCGSLRLGRLLIQYLRPGNYVGLEPNEWLIDDAIVRETGRDLITLKRPRFHHHDTFDLSLCGTEFDFVVAQSMFSHTGADLARLIVDQLPDVLNPGGLAAVTFIEREENQELPDATSVDGWVYPGCVAFWASTVDDLIQRAGLVGRRIPWHHPRQTWYLLARSVDALPPRASDPLLHGVVLRDPEIGGATES